MLNKKEESFKTEIIKEIGKRILSLRKEYEWTLKELSQKSNIQQQTINAIEKGKSKNPTVDIIIKLSTAFDISTDYLIFGKERNLKVIDVPSKKIYL